MTIANKTNPYCAFKSDGWRLVALLSRDVRLVLIALFSGGGAGYMLGRGLGWWS